MSEGREFKEDMSLVRKARGTFLSMATAYSLGALNDNFFKQTAGLLAVAFSVHELQGYATMLFTLPFLVLAAYAGWLADRFVKRRIIIAAKTLELAAMIIGLIALWNTNWTLMLTVVTLMGVHSTIFGPSLNGSIPDLYPSWYVTRANAHLKVATTAAILLGIALAGLVLRFKTPLAGVPIGQLLVGGLAIAIAVFGLIGSLGCPARPSANPEAPFPVHGPLSTLAVLWQTRRDRLLAITMVVDGYMWFLGQIQILLINDLGKTRLHTDETFTSLLIVGQVLGVAVGGLLAGRLTRRRPWQKLLAPSAGVLGLALGGMVILNFLAVPAGFAIGPWVTALVLLAVAGLAGGMMLIPLESFIQIRPRPEHRGSMIAAGNFAAFTGIALAGAVYVGLCSVPGLGPAGSLACLGGLTLVVGGGVLWALRGNPQ